MLDTQTLKITPDLLTLLSELDEFKGAWRAFGTLAPDRLAMLRQIATIESIGSSTRIEGSTLTDNEVELLLGRLNIQKFASRHEQEVAGYADVMDTIFASWSDIPITENHIKQLHRDLLKHSSKDERHRGTYKTLHNDVGAFNATGQMVGVVFKTATPFDTPQRMTELVSWFADTCELKRLHPLLAIAIFIVVFLEIHPFQDGNGRLSRVLTTLLLLQAGYIYVPYASLEAVIEQSKESLLSCPAPNSTDDSQRSTGLASLGAVFPARPTAAKAPPGNQDRARTTRPNQFTAACPGGARACTGSWARHE